MRTPCSRPREPNVLFAPLGARARGGMGTFIRRCGPSEPIRRLYNAPVTLRQLSNFTSLVFLPPANMPALYRAAPPSRGEHDVLNLPHIRLSVTFPSCWLASANQWGGRAVTSPTTAGRSHAPFATLNGEPGEFRPFLLPSFVVLRDHGHLSGGFGVLASRQLGNIGDR